MSTYRPGWSLNTRIIGTKASGISKIKNDPASSSIYDKRICRL